MNSITVLFFANLKDITGKRKIMIEIPSASTIADLKEQLIQDYPELDRFISVVIVSLNHEFADNEAIIPKDAEIAIFPPVSGGRK
ncbi:molybdopterin converting factor subunit 1 [Chloroflexota bacterium]